MNLFHRLFDKLYPLIRFVYERLQRHNWYDEIQPRLWLGGGLSYPRDYAFLLERGIGAVVDIRAERDDDVAFLTQHNIHYLKLRVPDVSAPPPEVIEAGVAFIQQQMANGRAVYVHCAKGRGRSATLVAGYLMKYEGLDFAGAKALMGQKRPLVKLENRHEQVLQTWLGASEK